MSHNIHVLRLAADSHSDALATAEVMIEDWGNENNWREFLYSICEDGTIHDGHGDCPPFDQAIKWLTDGITTDLNAKPISTERLIPLLAKTTVLIAQEKNYSEIASEIEMLDIISLMHFAREVRASQQITLEDNKIDPWTTIYKDWQLNEFGITELSCATEGGNEKLYLVIIDMHD